MAGYDLKEGYYNERNASEDELWSAFSVVFSSKSRNDASYKYGFLKSIIDNLFNVDQDLRLTFDQLFSKFAEIYWNLVLTCPSCNRKKSDRLPADYLLQQLEDRNQHIIVENHKFDKMHYRPATLPYVYNWAKVNGYEKLWAAAL